MMRRLLNEEGGNALVLVLGMMLLLAMMGQAAAGLAANELRMLGYRKEAMRARYLAEGGVELGRAAIHRGDYLPGTSMTMVSSIDDVPVDVQIASPDAWGGITIVAGAALERGVKQTLRARLDARARFGVLAHRLEVCTAGGQSGTPGSCLLVSSLAVEQLGTDAGVTIQGSHYRGFKVSCLEMDFFRRLANSDPGWRVVPGNARLEPAHFSGCQRVWVEGDVLIDESLGDIGPGRLLVATGSVTVAPSTAGGSGSTALNVICSGDLLLAANQGGFVSLEGYLRAGRSLQVLAPDMQSLELAGLWESPLVRVECPGTTLVFREEGANLRADAQLLGWLADSLVGYVETPF
ncbi:MAG: hypothetical protein QHH05_05610 [Syntrophomonadaceae bacterium]|jgi:hypothetical protein|nr:hypothetical protein [Syntrophomonadaceae bacterium]MDH7497904.1 hypothetical protein [Syntrophomonadaceae bacterium]